MEYLIQLGQASGKTVPIPRRLRESPNYSPCWRTEVFERYLIKIAEAKSQSSALSKVLSTESDPFIRQLLLFHFGRRCVIPDAVRYALECRQSEAQNQIAGRIKAMVVSGRTAEEIALGVGTDPRNIRAFEKLYFDARRFLENRVWLKQLCYPSLLGNEPAYRQAEARWLAIAFEYGWAGLGPILSPPRPVSPQSGRDGLGRLVRVLLSRSGDYAAGLEISGVRPSERDLQLLLHVQHRIEALGLPLRLQDLNYMEPLDPKEEKRRAEAKQLVGQLSATSRRKIITLLQKIEYDPNRATPD